MRFAYADPPYPGKARRFYRGHPDYRGEVDQAELIARLVDGWPDGWALSTSAAALPDLLPLCPRGVRVAAWLRGMPGGVRARAPVSAWEPVVFAGGRRVASLPAVPDALAYTARPRMTDPGRVVGAKPAAFAWWLFDLLGARPGDELADLYPGSGGIARAWSIMQAAALEASPAAGGDASHVDDGHSWPLEPATPWSYSLRRSRAGRQEAVQELESGADPPENALEAVDGPLSGRPRHAA